MNVVPFVSGSRLRAKVYVGADGSRHFIGIHDSTLGIDCAFANLGGGDYRCAPLVSQGFYTNVFATDECTKRATGFETSCGPYDYYVDSEPQDQCDGVPRRNAYDVGQQIPNAYTPNTGTCEPYTDVPGTSWHEVTPVDAETFVSASLDDIDLGGGLSLRVVEGAEGSRGIGGLWFDERPCSAVDVTGAGLYCIPTPRLALFAYFLDDQCTTSVGYTPVSTGCDPSPVLAVTRSVPDECGSVTSLVRVTPFSGNTVYYRTTGDACTQTTIDPSPLTRWAVGAAVDPGAFPALSQYQAGAGRLRSTVTQTQNGSTLGLSTTIYDTELGQTCTPQRFEDGIIRCVPTAAGLSPYYADANCMVPVMPVLPCSDSPFHVAQSQSIECGNETIIRAVYRSGATHSGPVYEHFDDTGCVEFTGTGYDEYRVLDPISPSELVAMTVEVE